MLSGDVVAMYLMIPLDPEVAGADHDTVTKVGRRRAWRFVGALGVARALGGVGVGVRTTGGLVVGVGPLGAGTVVVGAALTTTVTSARCPLGEVAITTLRPPVSAVAIAVSPAPLMVTEFPLTLCHVTPRSHDAEARAPLESRPITCSATR